MNNIKVKLVEAHQSQLKNFDVKKELQSVQEYVNGLEIELENRTVFLVCIQGNYDDFGKRTNTVFVIINNCGKAIRELHGVIKVKSCILHTVQFAKATIDFDEALMGKIENNEGMLVHLNIPTRGLNQNKIFKSTELEVEFTDVRVTYVDE